MEVLEYLYKLKFDEDPNYGKIEFLFKKIMMEKNIEPSTTNLPWHKKDEKKEAVE